MRLEDNEVMYSSIRLLFLLAFTAGSQVLGQAAWQSSWDEFLKAYQICVNDKQCDPTQFQGAVVTWEGTYLGTTVVNGSTRFQTRMTPGTMIDRTGTSYQVSNILLHSPDAAAVGAWQALGANQLVRFNAQIQKFLGAGFESNCCFIVNLEAGASVVLPSTPSIAENAIVNAASFQPGIVPDSWFTIQGTNLSSTTATWDASIVNGKLPTTIDSVSVNVGGKPAFIYYVSPTQISALAPDGGIGALSVTVTNGYGTSAPSTVASQAVGPAFFLLAGKYAIATRLDFSLVVQNGTVQGLTTAPARPGDVIILWGTGFGPTSPSAPVGVVLPSDKTYSTANPVTVTVGDIPAHVYGAALAPGFAGLYQIAIQVPVSAPDGDLPVVATVSGTQSPARTLITVRH
jgi:uncharacterized protein (TIGR03437 family)